MKEEIENLIKKLEKKVEDKIHLGETMMEDGEWFHAKIVAYRDCIGELKKIINNH
jgi:hypothetical protein